MKSQEQIEKMVQSIKDENVILKNKIQNVESKSYMGAVEEVKKLEKQLRANVVKLSTLNWVLNIK